MVQKSKQVEVENKAKGKEKLKRDTSTYCEPISGQKRSQINGGSSLTSFLKTVFKELHKGYLKYAEET